MHEYAGVKERWHRLSPGTQSLPYWQAEAIAGEIYRSMTADRHDDPQQASITSLSTEKAFVNGPPKIAFAGKNQKGTAALVEKLRTSRNAKRIDGWLSAHGYILTPDSQELVRKAVDKAFLQAASRGAGCEPTLVWMRLVIPIVRCRNFIDRPSNQRSVTSLAIEATPTLSNGRSNARKFGLPVIQMHPAAVESTDNGYRG